MPKQSRPDAPFHPALLAFFSMARRLAAEARRLEAEEAERDQTEGDATARADQSDVNACSGAATA